MKILLGSSSTPWWRRLTLLDVIVVTTPLLAIVLWICGGAILDYHRIRQFDDWWSSATSVRKFAFFRAREAVRSLEMNEIAKRFSAEREDETLLRLRVDRDAFEAINGDVAANWGEWVDVQILDAGDLTEARLRFRGDGSAHWTSEKKSFTLRTKGKELYHGFRSLAFSVKDVLPQWLVGSIAKDFGLLAPEQQLVPVYLNDEFYGIHRFVEPIDESFLRRNLQMPGNIFRADTAERGDYFKGLPREVFANPMIWDRVANNDRPGAFGTALLQEFLRDLNDATPEGRERFMNWLDPDELSRLLAFLLVCGDPYHMSGVHNQFWYEDPTSGKLHPIVWDVRLLDLEKPPRDSNINRFWRAALEDPRIWDGAMREVAKWLEGDKLYKLAEQRVNAAWERYRDEFEYDGLRAGVIPPVGDPRTTLATLRKNLDTLRGWLSDVRVEYSVVPLSEARRSFLLDVKVSGRVAARLNSVEISDSYTRVWKVSVFDGAQNAPTVPLASDDTTGDIFGAAEAALDVPLLPRVAVENGRLAFAPAGHRLRIELTNVFGDDSEPPRPDLELGFSRAIDGVPLEATALLSGSVMPSLPSTPSTAPEGREPVYLVGDVHLDRDLVTSIGQLLAIEVGTRLTLSPNVSILAKGPVRAIGTAHMPITITASDPNLPWGVFALQGLATAGSRFEYVKFERGGAMQLENVEYKGMVSVHNTRAVVFDHCEFTRNQRCDDAINVVKADASITNSWFHDTNADSIDYDMSSGLVAYNRIERSGNDGLDLMTCWPRVVGNTIVDSGDKGISVGEDSHPLVFGNTITGCERGIEVKDRSAPLVLHTRIADCEIGLHVNAKNWRYGAAGWPIVVRSSIDGLKEDHHVEDAGKFTVCDARFGGEPLGQAASIDLSWLYAQYGLATSESGIGPVSDARLIARHNPLVDLRFVEDFLSPDDGWISDGMVKRLVKRKSDLVATFRAHTGRIGKDVAWDLGDEGREYALVIEASTEQLAEARVVAVLAGAQLDDPRNPNAPLELSAAPNEYRYTSLRLPAGAYGALAFSATPQTEGKLRIHSVRVVAWPAGGVK